MQVSLITGPAVEPLTDVQAAAQARLNDDPDELDLLAGYVAAARAHVESYLRAQLITQTWRLSVSTLGRGVRLPFWPVQSVDQVTYVDQDGARQTLAADQYRLQWHDGEVYLVPGYGVSWPAHRVDAGSIEIDVVAGFGDAGADLPPDVLQAVRLLVAHSIEHREAVITGTISGALPLGVRALLDPHRRWV